MKLFTPLLLFVLTIGTGLEAIAQTYVPFLNSNALWEVRSVTNSGSMIISYNHHHVSLIQGGDTTVNGLTYQQMEGYNQQGAAYLREDTNNEQVFFLDLATGNEHLLYDFSLQVGDSIQDLSWDSSWVEVTAISTVMVNGTSRKRLEFQYKPGANINCQLFWVEGVGSSFGPVWFWHGDCWHSGIDLLCYREKNSSSLTPLFGSICSPVGFGDLQNAAPEISLFPNPVIERVTISSSEPIREIHILNASGAQVENHVLASPQNNTEVDLSGLSKGIYLLQINSGHRTYTRKISKLSD